MNIPIDTMQEQIMQRKKEIQEKRNKTTNEFLKFYYDGQIVAYDNIIIDLFNIL
jgi:hypothetical protein